MVEWCLLWLLLFTVGVEKDVKLFYIDFEKKLDICLETDRNIVIIKQPP